ncbi:MAG: hypothetical protein K5Q19_03235, partial [Novosphingobium sp.]|nr:hypothetical protein [Novosphingobium sp.]
ETYRMAMDWKPDLANWSMYTPWPFSNLFEELGDKVEIHDFDKYNFVTPIIKPAAMDRAELLDRVMNNYRRFYMRKALFSYPWQGTGYRRKYLLGCLKAFLKAGFQRTFYDLGRVNYWGPQSKKGVDFKFDRTRTNHRAETGDWKAAAETSRKAAAREAVVHEAAGVIKACGGGTEQLTDEEADAFDMAPTREDAPGRSGAHI